MPRAIYGVFLAAGCALACIAMGSASAAASPRDAWFEALSKPSWMPPGWLFGIVWTLLYAMMGVAFAMMLLPNGKPGGRRIAVVAFVCQLTLNLAWSPTFFRFHAAGAAMLVIVTLWFAIAWTITAFWSVRDLAGVLLLPYWAWLTFTIALNAAIWRMN